MTKTIESIQWHVVSGIVFTDKFLRDNIEKDMEQNLTMGINFTAHFILSNQILTNGMKVKLSANDKTQNSNGNNKTKRPEPIQIRRTESIPHLRKNGTSEEQRSPESVKTTSSEVKGDGDSTLLSPTSASGNGYGSAGGGGAITTSFTSLATTPLTASHNLRNGGGVGGGDGSRAKLGGSNRNRLNEIFEEPINISEYINSSPDKDVCGSGSSLNNGVGNNSVVSPGGSNSNSFGMDGSGGIGGGYFIETKESFIFTFDAKKPKKGILSRVSNPDKAIYHHENTGPNFLDLKMRGHSEDDEKCYYRQFVYDKNLKIKTSKENNFSIDEYEVFRVITL
ncbi:13254_t:CDS:2 [Entrophospora sp. SA101]|nr:13254_t:CDS:2 [Entrophospora sp. SA101]